MKKVYLAQVREVPQVGFPMETYVRFLSNGNREYMIHSTPVIKVELLESNNFFRVETRSSIYIVQLI